jgi:hypothetical protein
MKKIQFETPEEFDTLFRNKTEAVTDVIVECIQDAMMKRKKVADLFEVSFVNVENAYVISLNSVEWETALTSCLQHYHENSSDPDKAIDTWKLLEAVKLY